MVQTKTLTPDDKNPCASKPQYDEAFSSIAHTVSGKSDINKSVNGIYRFKIMASKDDTSYFFCLVNHIISTELMKRFTVCRIKNES